MGRLLFIGRNSFLSKARSRPMSEACSRPDELEMKGRHKGGKGKKGDSFHIGTGAVAQLVLRLG